MFTLGRQHFLYVTDLKLVKEISIFKSWDLGKPAYLQKDRGTFTWQGPYINKWCSLVPPKKNDRSPIVRGEG